MRIQQGLVVMKTSMGSAAPTLDLIDELARVVVPVLEPSMPDFEYSGFVPNVSISGLSFTYPGKTKPAIRIDDLVIPQGCHVAVVGPSGAGKTTFVDLLLGVLTPTVGKILISGRNPVEAVKEWPGAMSYVPQDVMISRGGIIQNIALGFEENEIDESRVSIAIAKSELGRLVAQMREENIMTLGEMGSSISGGQRQRIGIARSLYTNPKLLVLDEATSSLDAETEKLIADRLSDRDLGVTLITIAHRLSTVRSADFVIYIDEGKIISTGSFSEVRNVVPDFDYQANLMGLANE
jgi:ABC-type bacteriocin/lantibiotic exporter with double-glycine peptidase domain